MTKELRGLKIAILLAPMGTEQAEFIEPRQAVERAGATVDVIGIQAGRVHAVHHDLGAGDAFAIDKSFDEAAVAIYAALIVPGGSVGADRLSAHAAAVDFVRGFFVSDKPVGAVGYGPAILVEADMVRNRTLTSYPGLRTHIAKAGGHWVDEAVVRDDKLITSRKPDDLEAFCAALIESVAAGNVRYRKSA